MNKCSKCNSSNITYRINYDFGEKWDEDRDDNVIHCLDCGHEIDDNTNIKK
jgi:DNA-directed RNA polymerase subunit RPC12/RpoP